MGIIDMIAKAIHFFATMKKLKGKTVAELEEMVKDLTVFSPI